MIVLGKNFFYILTIMRGFVCLFFVLVVCSCTSTNKSGVFNVMDYGAKADSCTINTIAFSKAIDAAYCNGGGRVVVPPGVYVTGTIELKSNIVLEIQEGAKIVGSSNYGDYSKHLRPIFISYKKNPVLEMMHLIVVKNCENVTICGGGTIHGNGDAFWEPSGEMPSWIHAKKGRVSNLIEIQYSKKIKVKDLFLTMSPEWTLHAVESSHVEISGVRIDNGLYGPNNDGIDITSCKDVVISNCDIITCDDAICFKASEKGGSCERAVVTNCLIQTSCAALKVGSNLVYHPIRDICFSNCVITTSSRAIGLYSTRGSVVENISFSNIICKTNSSLVLNRPIQISVWNESMYQWEPSTSSVMRNILISGFTCETDGRILIAAQDGCVLENVTLRDIFMKYPRIEDPSLIASGHTSTQGAPTNPEARSARASLVADNVTNLVVDNYQVVWPTNSIPSDWIIPVRIENGTDRRFDSTNYNHLIPRQTEFSVMWLRNVHGGYVWAPSANASISAVDDFKITNSSCKILVR